jgi:hypothetical protein
MAAALSAGRELGSGKAVLALAFSQEWQRPLHQDGVSVADSRAHLSVLALSLALRIAPHWTVVTGVSNSFWPDGMGRNRDARVGLNSGIRYGHF